MSFIAQLDLNLADKLREGLIAQGFEIFQPPYTLFQGKKKGVTCTLYTSGKLMVQGKEMTAFIQFYLEPEILNSFTYGYQNLDLDLSGRIGVDESGKGDFFGPLCIGGVYAEGNGVQKLAEIGVKDSKKLSDASVLKIAQKIKKDYLYHIVRIGPENIMIFMKSLATSICSWVGAMQLSLSSSLKKAAAKKSLSTNLLQSMWLSEHLRGKNKKRF